MNLQSTTFRGPWGQTLSVGFVVPARDVKPIVHSVVRHQEGTAQDITDSLAPEELGWLVEHLMEMGA